jgi:hypothetical protein
MPEASKTHRIYRALLHLYPKGHRDEYGGQMVQTFEDLLSDPESGHSKFSIWLRVGSELPVNVIEEHIHNLEGMSVETRKTLGKRLVIGFGALGLILLGALVVMFYSSNKQPVQTTLAEVQNNGEKVACLLTQDDSNLVIQAGESTYVANAAMTGIIDVPAGTNVDVHIKTYDGTNATGTSVYPDKYGSYNFTLKKTGNSSTDTYTGGWLITQIKACQ